ncbi:Subtilase family protein, partial [Algoriphagus alkaliphilus]
MLTQEDSYYWSANQKHSLQEDRNHVIISVASANVDVVKSKIQAAYSVRNINLLRSVSGLLIEFSQNAPSLESLIRSHPQIEAAAYGLRLEGEGPPVFPTGEILLQPKEGMEIHGILKLISAEYLSYEATKYDTYTIRIKDWQKVISLANKIYESGLVRYSHPNFIAAIERYQVTPTDPLYVQQYYLNQGNNIDINAPQAWQLSRGLSQVRVAVIDDGVEAHEDLNGRVVQGFTPTDPNGFGTPADPTWPDNIFPFTPASHGQACAGIIGATHENVGVAGVYPCAQIVPINIFNEWFIDDNGSFQFVNYNEDVNDLRNAIDWAWNEGQADVLSNSWGFRNQNANFDAITFAINRARTLGRGGLGSVVVFASGNEHQTFSGVTFPANVNGVIAVGAIDRNGNIWNYSSRGPQMDLVAPSGNVGGAGDLVTTDRMGNLG